MRLFIKIYGLGRMTLGLAQIVGLFSAFFLKELLIQYPPQVFVYLLDQDLVAVTYLVILLRSLFHVFAGIGMARIKTWTRLWFFWGWPVVLGITFGLIYSFSYDWLQQGHVAYLYQIIAWPRLLLYLCFIGFDVFFIAHQLKVLNERKESAEEEQELVTVKQIILFGCLIVFFFSLLLFFGRPIKKGFHEGYYKVKQGKSPSQGNIPERRSSSLSSEKKAKDKLSLKKESALPKEQRASSPQLRMVLETEREEVVSSPKEQSKTIISRQGFSYAMLIGILSGLLIIGGFSFHLLDLLNDKESSLSVFSCVIIGLGFLLLCVYAMTLKAPLLIAIGSITALIIFYILLFKIKGFKGLKEV